MQFDRIRIEPRLRNTWQAIDLGWTLARTWWWPLFLSWFIPNCALFVCLLLLLPTNLWWLASFLPWWFKPLWDTAPLYILSRLFFGEPVSLRNAWIAALRNARWEILPWLTWRRFSPTRSMDLPVTVLEHLRGKVRSQRLGVLHLQNSNAAGWLTMVCANLEMVIGTGLIGLIAWMLPNGDPVSFTDIFTQKDSTFLLSNYICFFIGTTLVAPFYVAAGFSLYINRRIELEGWDIEIRFRHIANSVKAPSQQLRTSLLVLLMLALLSPLLSSTSYAENSASKVIHSESKNPKDPSQQRIEKILGGSDFKSDKTEKHWRLKKKTEQQAASEVPEWLIRLIETLEKITGFSRNHQSSVVGFVDGVRTVFWIVLITLFAYLLFRFRDNFREWLHLPIRQRALESTPEILFGLDVRSDSLPDDVIAQVNQFWQQQQFREALSLLYRASLAKLLHRFNLPFRDDMTEGECAQLVAENTRVEITEFFSRLTRAWQCQAYAHVSPTSASVQELCRQWQQVFRDER